MSPLRTSVTHQNLNRKDRTHGAFFIRRRGINSYADDTQLSIPVSPDDLEPIDSLFNCILDLKSWMADTCLQLNQEKAEVLVIAPEGEREKLCDKI